MVNVGWAFSKSPDSLTVSKRSSSRYPSVVGEIGHAAASAALTWWSQRPQRASAGPATVARKKKSVTFDLSQNQVKVVERWISVGPVTAARKKKVSILSSLDIFTALPTSLHHSIPLPSVFFTSLTPSHLYTFSFTADIGIVCLLRPQPKRGQGSGELVRSR